jgi:hypothetical protein
MRRKLTGQHTRDYLIFFWRPVINGAQLTYKNRYARTLKGALALVRKQVTEHPALRPHVAEICFAAHRSILRNQPYVHWQREVMVFLPQKDF